MGPIGVKTSRLMVVPMYKLFFRDIPESKLLFDIDGMIEDGIAFDYSTMPADVIAASWVPSYCRVEETPVPAAAEQVPVAR
jgi:hypothetical protein